MYSLGTDAPSQQLDELATKLCVMTKVPHDERFVESQWVASLSDLTRNDAAYVGLRMIDQGCNPMKALDAAAAERRRRESAEVKAAWQRVLPYAVVTGVVLVGALGYAIYTTRKRA